MFNPTSGRCLDIAVDHGFFGEKAFLQGIEDLPAAVDTLVAASPDAIQLTVGQARLLQSRGGRERPALVLRTDVANVYGAPLPDHMFDLTLPNPGLAGVKLDAACVVVNLFDLPGRPEVREACIRAVLNAKVDCEKYGMPLMVEPLVMKQAAGGYGVDGDLDKILPHRAPGRRTRRRRHQGGPLRRPDPLPPGHPDRHRHPGARARRRTRRRRRAVPPHPGGPRAGRRRNRLRTQHHPARQPRRHDARAHGHAPRRRRRRPPPPRSSPARHERPSPSGSASSAAA